MQWLMPSNGLNRKEVIFLTEEKKGHAKVTLEVELNEAFMELLKEGAKNMPQMGGMMRRMMQRRGEEGNE